MKQSLFTIAFCGLLFVTLKPDFSASQEQPAPRKGFFEVLQVGQMVNLNPQKTGTEINWLEGNLDIGSHKVIRITPEYIDLRDIADVSNVRISKYAVTSLRSLRKIQ